MARRKIEGELNELLKNPGGTKGIRTLGAYRKNGESADLSDNASKAESESRGDDESKGKEDDLEGKSSQECAGQRSDASKLISEANSKGKTASAESKGSSKAAGGVCGSSKDDGDGTVDKDSNVKEQVCSGKGKTDEADSTSEKQEKTGKDNKKDNSADKQCAEKSGENRRETAEEQTGTQSKEKKNGNRVNIKRRPVIGPELLPKPDRSKVRASCEIKSQDSDSAFAKESKRSSFHERYVRKEISDYNSNVEGKEAESSDINSNVKKVPMIGRMGFSLDLNKELNAKFAAARLQMTGRKKHLPITEPPAEGKKQPPVPLPRPRRPEGKTSFEVKRERSKRGLLVEPDEKREEKIEGSSKFVDLDTGHIYEDIDLYEKPQKCEACKKETAEKYEEEVRDGDGKKDEKKKKKSKLRMLCMCRQTSSDLPSASLSEKTDSKTCLLTGENKPGLIAKESNKKDGEEGYERLQRQKPSFRGGYEALRNSSPEEEEPKSSPEGAKAGGVVVKRREFKNESSKSESVVSGDSSFSSEQLKKHVSKESSYESKSESSSSSKKSVSKTVRFEEKTENIVEESSEEHHSSGTFEQKLGVDTKRREVLYAKVMKTSHKSEHSESVVEAEEVPSGFSKANRMHRFGAVPVLPFEGRLPIMEKDGVEGRFVPEPTQHIVNGGDVSPAEDINLNDVPETALLDTSASKSKAQLASSGALANRRPPTKGGALIGSNDEDEDDEPFVQHDSNGTVRKNRRYQKNWPENPNGEGLAEFYDGEGDDLPPELPSTPPPPIPAHADWDGGLLYSNEYLGTTPSESVSLKSESVSSLDHLGFYNNYSTNRPDSRDNASDTSSISQTSYDPSKPMFTGMASEIPDSIPTATDDTLSGGVVLLSSKSKGDASAPSGVRSLFGKSSSSSSGGGGGITLLSSRPLSASHGDVPSSTSRNNKGDGGIVLLSSKSLHTGYEQKAGSMTALSGASSGGMVGEYDMTSRGHSYDFATATLSSEDVNEGSKRPSQYSSRPVNEWTTQQVCHWLLGINMDHYAAEFMAKGIDGNQLLLLDSAKLKTLGVNSSNDKNVIKKKIKDLKTAIEKERKQQEKAQKAKEKLEGKGKKKFGFGK